MTNETKNVPELRFKEFSKEWEYNNLKDITTLLKDGTHGTHKNVENGPWLLSAKNIKNNTINISDEDRKISITDYNKIYKNYTLEREDILLSIVGTIGRVSMVKDPVNIAFQRSVAIIRFSKPLESKFFLYLFGTKEFKKKLYRNQVVSAQPGIYLGDLAKFNIIYPLIIEEQQKIGEFFSKLDKQIELEEQKLSLLEEQKKGYMQKIFSQELRFKDENGNTFEEWKNTNFNYFMSEPDNLEKGIDLRKDQLLTVKLEGNGISKANINRALKMGSTVYYKRFAGQFIYGKQNFFNGAFGIVPKFLNNYYSSGDVPALNIDYSKIDSKYFINYISRKDYYKKKEAFSTGTGSKRIHEKTLLDFDIMLPSVEEQEKIGDFFNELDELIEKQSNKIKLLKERKKGFLQKMFV